MLEETANTMDALKKNRSVTETMTKITCELIRTKMDPTNPMNIFPPNPNTNIWCEINKYAMEKQKTLFDLIQLLTDNLEKRTTTKDVIESGSELATLQALASGNHQHTNAVLKMNTIFFDANSLNNRGLDMASKLGITQILRQPAFGELPPHVSLQKIHYFPPDSTIIYHS